MMNLLAEAPTPDPSRGPSARQPRARRNSVGMVSLLAALGGTAMCHIALAPGAFGNAAWLRILATGFEAALVGGLADWFAVTALFRHPLGLPIPHTAILPARRAKIIEGIISMIQEEWLSPAVIRARLARISPSAFVVDWLRDPAHVGRLASPARELLRRLARLLAEEEITGFIDRTLQQQLRELPITPSAGRWLRRAAASESADVAFGTLAQSLANLFTRPDITVRLYWWLDRLAHTLQEDGQRLMAFFLRRKAVQQKIVEAVCSYATSELGSAARDPQHPLRMFMLSTLHQFADRLAAGDPESLGQIERWRTAIVESLATTPLVGYMLARLSDQLERELTDPSSALSGLIERKLLTGLLELLGDPERRATFDQWVRSTASDLVQRHHHEIGVTVRENLEALETGALVAQIEERVGADLQFIRLNGAVVGGLIGLVLGLGHWLAS
ncbi:MAG TPA: DUF445 domain-containing protein [Candidatus Binatia bacterium]|nr:DUF445 domain-containing protein [Candidatus Binatia bacterium]